MNYSITTRFILPFSVIITVFIAAVSGLFSLSLHAASHTGGKLRQHNLNPAPVSKSQQRYIVLSRQGLTKTDNQRLNHQLSQIGARIINHLPSIQGSVVLMSQTQAELIRELPQVNLVEPDQQRYLQAEKASWGLGAVQAAGEFTYGQEFCAISQPRPE